MQTTVCSGATCNAGRVTVPDTGDVVHDLSIYLRGIVRFYDHRRGPGHRRRAARDWPPPASTAPYDCGTHPPDNRSENRSPATSTAWRRWPWPRRLRAGEFRLSDELIAAGTLPPDRQCPALLGSRRRRDSRPEVRHHRRRNTQRPTTVPNHQLRGIGTSPEPSVIRHLRVVP